MIRLQRVFTALVFVGLLSASFSYAEPAKSETAGQYVDDSVITTKVKAAIFGDESLKSMQINVKTYQGVVQLSGFVSTQANIYKAAEVARNVGGVTNVRNDMRLK